MATNVILPALGMAQDTGKIVQWLKTEGEQVAKGEPLLEIETDKATVEVEAPADGVLAHITAAAGEDIPVGQVIATILAPGEVALQANAAPDQPSASDQRVGRTATPLALRIAAEHNLNLHEVQSAGKRIQKADVLVHLQKQDNATSTRLVPASPKARRLAAEQGKQLSAINGSGPGGAVLAADVLATTVGVVGAGLALAPATDGLSALPTADAQPLSNIWRIMAQRTTQSWTTIPHFSLVREVNASRLISWRKSWERLHAGNNGVAMQAARVTYTDLLVKIVAAALRLHPRLNALWNEQGIALQREIHVGLAVAVEAGLVVPVIHQADKLTLDGIAQQRTALVEKALAGKLRPQDISNGTFTISNLGMYHVDAFNAIINQPQVAILAIGRIAERVVPLNGQPAVQPMMVLTLSCDHRAVDGARGAQFLDTVAAFIEEPAGLVGSMTPG
ncbi:MAG TPA: dihydrolipoamide acetyltransferase family protein [Ktedonosporobacter sp.]|jgi:pyruvate dehydrogenase E2 component (dihydrolipoamide acetyltransferase)|nr:dihydrolipoamide acetyltransferase family protein [Ktedonosporobacter sp.]